MKPRTKDMKARGWPLWRAACRRLRAVLDAGREDSGGALVEVALIVSLMGVPLLLGTAETGLVVYDSVEVSNAAHAGALYGMQSLVFAADTVDITASAQAEAADFGTRLAVTPALYYACSSAVDGTQYTGSNAQSAATLACTGTGNHPLEFIQVNTSVTVTPAIHAPGLPSSFTLHGLSVMEIEQ